MSDKLKVLSPFDGHLISEIEWDDAEKLEQMLATAHRLAGNPDNVIPAPQRIAILEKTANLVESKVEAFSRQAAEEGGKPLIDSRIELDRAVQGIREAARSINQLTGREVPMNLTASSMNRVATTRREPIGVVAAVSAFNHPFNLIVHQVIPAVAVGCPVIVKPATTTPLSCFNLVNCLYEAGLPKEWCHILVCDNEVAEKLVTDSRVAFFLSSVRLKWVGTCDPNWRPELDVLWSTEVRLPSLWMPMRMRKTRYPCWRRAVSIMPGRFVCPCNACSRMSPSSMPWPVDWPTSPKSWWWVILLMKKRKSARSSWNGKWTGWRNGWRRPNQPARRYLPVAKKSVLPVMRRRFC
jgi:hypothetical protein